MVSTKIGLGLHQFPTKHLTSNHHNSDFPSPKMMWSWRKIKYLKICILQSTVLFNYFEKFCVLERFPHPFLVITVYFSLLRFNIKRMGWSGTKV